MDFCEIIYDFKFLHMISKIGVKCKNGPMSKKKPFETIVSEKMDGYETILRD